MNRNLTPRPVRATGAKEAHGSILDPGSGALYVHMHRESGLAHRHYVLKAWQVRLLRFALSRPMLLFYVAATVMWAWMASEAFVRVPLLERRVGVLTREARRLDTLTLQLTEMQERYRQVQRMLGPTQATKVAAPIMRPVTPPAAPAAAPQKRPATDSTKDSTRDTTGTKTAPPTID